MKNLGFAFVALGIAVVVGGLIYWATTAHLIGKQERMIQTRFENALTAGRIETANELAAIKRIVALSGGNHQGRDVMICLVAAGMMISVTGGYLIKRPVKKTVLNK